MRKHIILFFSALLIFTACKFDKTPPGVLKQDKMTDLLMAVHVVDGSVYNIDPNPDSLYKFGTARYLVTFKAYHTDSAQFNRSLKYYSMHPDQLQIMYADIIKKLTKKQDSLNKVIAKQNSKHALPAK
jgi:hypothetical protein